jgi:CO/xanthine dehydrogenase Mo-binding subunit
MAREARRGSRVQEPELARSEGPRVDLRAKVTGQAQYLEDLPEPANLAFAATIRSPYSHARIVSIDASAALAQPGVLAVLTRDQLDEYELNQAPEPWDQHFVCTDRARFDGDLIGMIVADDLRTARRAAQMVDVEYEILPPIFSASEALAPDAPAIYEEKGDNEAAESLMAWGDVEAGFAQADLIVEGTFSCPSVYHHPIEPVMSIIADWTSDVIELWTPSNNAFDVVDVTAKLFGVQPEQVRVHVPFVGGNFGAKHWTRELSVAAALSSRIGRPVKYVAPEEEGFLVTARHAMTYRGKVGVKSDGTVVALAVDIDLDTGARANTAELVNGQATSTARGAYSVPNLRARARSAFTNKVSSAHFRNTGKSQPQFGVEMLMDQAARQLGIDPIEFKSKNLQKRGEGLAARGPRDSTGSTSSATLDIDFPSLMKMAVEAIGWDGRATRHSPEESAARFVRGRGLAVSLRRGSANGVASALAVLDRDGSVSISHNAPDVGGGEYTMISLVAAKTLGIPQSQIRVGETDTANRLRYGGTSSQRTTVHMGNAVQDACEQLKAEILRAAARLHGGKPDEWQLTDGLLERAPSPPSSPAVGEGVKVSLADLARPLPEGEALRGSGFYEQTASPEGAGGATNNYWSPGVSAVEVEIDRETGDVRIARYAALADAGTIMHYHSARGQIEGGAILGLGATLFEEVVYGEGQLLNADPFQYRLPQLGDIPEDFETIILEAEKGPGPFGAKGIANTSIGCVAPAVGNAIYDAIGVRLTSLPFTPEKILRALGTLPPEAESGW